MPSEVGTTTGVPHPDPRPATHGDERGVLLAGWRCASCGRPSATAVHWCPVCRQPVREASFGPAGTVWSSTVVRVPLPGREPPFVLAYVDLDDGPRVLAHVAVREATRLRVGDRVRLTEAADGLGDPTVEATS